jgi:hypothetical protein
MQTKIRRFVTLLLGMLVMVPGTLALVEHGNYWAFLGGLGLCVLVHFSSMMVQVFDGLGDEMPIKDLEDHGPKKSPPGDYKHGFEYLYAQSWWNEYEKMTKQDDSWIDRENRTMKILVVCLASIIVALYFNIYLALIPVFVAFYFIIYDKIDDIKRDKESWKIHRTSTEFVIRKAFRNVKEGEPIVFDSNIWGKKTKGKKNNGKVFYASLFKNDYIFAEHNGKWYSRLITRNEPWIPNHIPITVSACYEYGR